MDRIVLQLGKELNQLGGLFQEQPRFDKRCDLDVLFPEILAERNDACLGRPCRFNLILNSESF